MKYKKEYELAKEAAKLAGDFLSNATEKNVLSSIGHDIKLELDKETEKLILSLLSKSSNYPVLGEETGLSQHIIENEPYWIVDPIDGTLNFLHEIPFACISIALWKGDESLIGVIYDFSRNEMISSLKDEGAFLNEKKLEAPSRVVIEQAILTTGFPSYLLHDTETLMDMINKIKTYKKIRLFGSAALSLAYVALGRVHSYLENNIKLWDVAAGIAICKELGMSSHIKILNKDEFLYYVEISNLKN